MKNRIVVLLFGMVIAACGFMYLAPSGPDPKDDARGVQTAVHDYIDAFVKGDGEAACARLTDSAREAVAGAATRVGASNCADAFARTRKLGGSAVVAAAREIRVRKIELTNRGARAVLRYGGQDSVAELEKVGGEWKIATLPKA
jgi:hypothetical protein